MAVNGNICQTAFADLGKLPKKLSITQLQVALANLNALKGNVQNCNCAPVELLPERNLPILPDCDMSERRMSELPNPNLSKLPIQ